MADNGHYMQEALKEALHGVHHNHGGPFGAVIVRDGEIIARAHNEVIHTNDPTAHAEILAIRRASLVVNSFDLHDCVLYTTCEPCPMCFAAIHWAKISRVYYGCTRKDAAEIGFDDEYIYEVIKGTAKQPRVEMLCTCHDECRAAFREWEQKEDKVMY